MHMCNRAQLLPLRRNFPQSASTNSSHVHVEKAANLDWSQLCTGSIVMSRRRLKARIFAFENELRGSERRVGRRMRGERTVLYAIVELHMLRARGCSLLESLLLGHGLDGLSRSSEVAIGVVALLQLVADAQAR